MSSYITTYTGKHFEPMSPNPDAIDICDVENPSGAWKIKHIFDGDYGCEERLPGEEPKVSVTLVNEVGEEKQVTVEDDWLIDNGLDVGSEWPRLGYE